MTQFLSPFVTLVFFVKKTQSLNPQLLPYYYAIASFHDLNCKLSFNPFEQPICRQETFSYTSCKKKLWEGLNRWFRRITQIPLILKIREILSSASICGYCHVVNPFCSSYMTAGFFFLCAYENFLLILFQRGILMSRVGETHRFLISTRSSESWDGGFHHPSRVGETHRFLISTRNSENGDGGFHPPYK